MSASHRAFVAAIAAMVLLAPEPAAALSADEARRLIGSWLASASSSNEFDTKGELTVEESGEEIVARLPTLVLRGESTAMEVPDIVLRLRNAGEDRIGFAARLPDRFAVFELDTRETAGTVTIGSHRFEGIYMPSVQAYQQLAASFEDVVLSAPSTTFRIGSLAADYDSDEIAPDDWTIGGEFTVNNLELVGKGGQRMASLAQLVQRFHAENVRQRSYASKLQEIFGQGAFPNTESATPEQLRQLESFFLAAPDYFGPLRMEIEMKDAMVTSPRAGTTRIGRFALNGSMEATDSELSRLSLDGTLSGFDLPASATARLPAAVLPSLLDIRARLDRFPGSAIWRQLVSAAFAAGEANGRVVAPDAPNADANAAMKAVGPRLMAAMAEAGTVLDLPKLELVIGPANLRGNASFGLPPNAAPGQPFAADIAIAGLDELMEQVTSGPEPVDQNVMGALVFLRGLGQPKTGPGGEREYRYKLSRGQDGRLLLNGMALGQVQPQ